MKGKELYVMIFILIPLTLLMAYDFFPKLNDFLFLPKPMLIGLLLLVVLLGFFTIHFQEVESAQSSFWWNVSLVSYLLSLIVIFTLLGGNSQVGISLSSPVLWIVVALTVFEMKKEYEKAKAHEVNA
ncbi:hypothetical protein [Sporosarcina sp. ITBMC105]